MLARSLDPPPRAFAFGEFRFDTNRDGLRGTAEDLRNVLSNGAARYGGSPLMPPWATLTDAQIDALAMLVLSYAREAEYDRAQASGGLPEARQEVRESWTRDSRVWGVLGLLATIVFGIVTLRRRQIARLAFVREICIGLFDDVVRNLPDLSIRYRGDPISENLVLLRGAIINVGTKDISPHMVEEPLAAELPDGYRWLTAKIVSATEGTRAEAKLEGDTTIALETGLLRRHECFRFEALALVPEGGANRPRSGDAASELSRSLEFTHRIADTAKVATYNLGDQPGPWMVAQVGFLAAVVVGSSWPVVKAVRSGSAG